MRIYGITDRTPERLAELLAFPAFSLGFWALYLFCGRTDMADGPVTRRTGSANAFGARLDTAADAVFLAAALGKLLPVLAVPVCALAAAAAVQEGRGLRGGTPRIPPAGGNGEKQRGGDDL